MLSYSMRSRAKAGFTLIELLIVVAIISLLSSIVFASLTTARAKGKDAGRIENLKQLVTALELYTSDHNGFYPCPVECDSASDDDPSIEFFSLDSQNPSYWDDLASSLRPYLKKMPGNEADLGNDEGQEYYIYIVAMAGGCIVGYPPATHSVYLRPGSYMVSVWLENSSLDITDGGPNSEGYEIWGGNATQYNSLNCT